MRADEIRIYKAARRLAKRGDKLLLDTPSITMFSISANHALKCVRTNGRERLTTLITLERESDEFLSDLLETTKTLARAAELMSEFRNNLLAHFEVCPDCEGRQGMFDEPESWAGHGPWHDCRRCAGRGMLPVGASEWQDESRTYTPAERQLDVRIDGCTERREAAGLTTQASHPIVPGWR